MAKLRVVRNKKFVCSLVPFYIYLNNQMIGEVKNDKEVVLEHPVGDYELLITKIKIVNGRSVNSGYGGVIGAIVEDSNRQKELNKAHIHLDDNKILSVECESNAVDCQIISIY